ncbi:MAG: threonine--tRNA ligase [Chitinivibrionales bacterium]|nr:threonine--tRNA ligase [Chitinivibrionales bacterium]
MKIILPDGKSIDLPEGATSADVAKQISPKLAKAALAAKVNDALVDLKRPLSDGDNVAIVTFDSEAGKDVFWHSSSHIMAQAVQELFPDAKITIGPAIANGFYYDFDVERPFSTDDLEKIEAKCREIVKADYSVERLEPTKAETRAYFSDKGEIYKVELIDELDEPPSMYAQGGWRDLCRGPHLPSTGYVKAIKLLKVAGAYWRGDENKKMLQRIYGVSFPRQSMLDEHVHLLEEAQKRDHRKLGKELDLFSFHLEGAGFPFWHPKGMVLYNTIMDFCRVEHTRAGYREIKTPIILNEELWRRSGHWDKYRENMYFTEIDDVMHAVKPMNCPGHLLIFNTHMHSYRELPLKLCEFGLVHRHEKAGVLHGLFRVRQFTQDDAHIFCLPDQIEEQITQVISFIMNMYRVFGFEEYKIELSTRPEKYIGSIEIWDRAEKALENVLVKEKIDFQLNPGDGAFYGPKIDFHITDSLKRTWQCGTVQLDFSMPERFELEYTDVDGASKRPVMIHRALLGSMERFIGILIEHYGGALPVWLAPVQVQLIPVSDKFLDYARTVYSRLIDAGIRTELDERAEKVGYKIRNAELLKIPYMAIVGEREQENQAVSIRRKGEGDLGAVAVDSFIHSMLEEIDRKK